MVLREKLITFKAPVTSFFGKYQLSGIGTQIWNLLDYQVDVVSHVAGVRYLHSSLYERSFNILATLFAKCSKRRNFAMYDAKKRRKEKLNNQLFRGEMALSGLIKINITFMQ